MVIVGEFFRKLLQVWKAVGPFGLATVQPVFSPQWQSARHELLFLCHQGGKVSGLVGFDNPQLDSGRFAGIAQAAHIRLIGIRAVSVAFLFQVEIPSRESTAGAGKPVDPTDRRPGLSTGRHRAG